MENYYKVSRISLPINSYFFFSQRGKELFTPTAAWRPTKKSLDAPRSDSIVDLETTQQGPYDNMGYIM